MAAKARRRPRRVAGVARHRGIGVREMLVVLRHLRRDAAALRHELGAKRFHAEVHVARRDGIGGLYTFPLFVLFRHGALNHGTIGAPLKAAQAPRRAQRVEMTATFGSGGARSDERSFVANRAMAIDAVDFDGGTRLAVNFPVAMIILRKVAVVALHSLFQMNVREMHSLAEAVRIIERDLLAVSVQPVSLAVVIEDGAEHPAV